MSNTFKDTFLKNKRALSIGLILVCSLYIGAIFYATPDKLFTAFSKMDLFNWLLVLSCSLINYILRFIRWHYYLRYLQHKIAVSQHFLYYMTGFALTLTPAKIGETIRSTYLAQHYVPYTHSLAMFFTERFLDVVVISLLSLLSLEMTNGISSNNINNFIFLSIIVIVSFIPLLRQFFVTRFLEFLRNKIYFKKLQSLLKHLIHLLGIARELFSIKPAYNGIILGLIAWSIQGIAFHFILTTLNVELSLQQSVGIYAISLLAGALSFIPGGIGTTEAVMTLLLTLLGADTATAIAAALISRISTLWFAVVLGFSAAFVLSLRKDN